MGNSSSLHDKMIFILLFAIIDVQSETMNEVVSFRQLSEAITPPPTIAYTKIFMKDSEKRLKTPFQCPNGKDCKIHCDGTDSCSNKGGVVNKITCPPFPNECLIVCDGDQSCEGIVINAQSSKQLNFHSTTPSCPVPVSSSCPTFPHNSLMTLNCPAKPHGCDIFCTGKFSCQKIIINASLSQQLSITANNDSALIRSEIICGEFNSVTGKGDHSLQYAKFIAPHSQELTISADGRQSLESSNIICPKSTCLITAKELRSLMTAIIDGTHSSKLFISARGADALSYSNITCPETASPNPNCIIEMKANNNYKLAQNMTPITIYPNSHLEFLCDPVTKLVTNHTYFSDNPPQIKYANGTMACKNTIFNANLEFSCADPLSFQFENPKCYKTLAPTPNPSVSPTPMPSVSPTNKVNKSWINKMKKSLIKKILNNTYLCIAAAVVLIVIVVAVIAFCIYKCKHSQSNTTNLNDVEEAPSAEHLLNESDDEATDIEAGNEQSNVESSSSSSSNEEVECVQLKFTTKGRGQHIEEVHEELLDEMMNIDKFKSRIHEKLIQVKNEKKGEMTFILIQEEETAVDDQSEVIELLQNEKRVKHLEMFGMEETATVPKKKKKKRSKRKKSKKAKAKSKEERRSSIYKYGLNQIGKPWISIERQQSIQKMKWEATGKKGRWQDTKIW